MVDTEEHQERRTTWSTINKKHLPLKAFYFFLAGGTGMLLPFIPLYMKEEGRTSAQTGVINGFMPFLAFFVRPFFGIIADRLKKHHIILAICCMMSAVFYLVLLFIPNTVCMYTDVKTEIQCKPKGAHIKDCYDESENQTCPLSLSRYMDFMNIKNNTGNMSSSFNDGVTNSFNRKGDNSDPECIMTCRVKGEQLRKSSICFSSKNEDVCLDWSAMDQTDYSFLLNGFSYIRKEKMDLQTDENFKCQIFTFQHITYQNQTFPQIFCNEDLPLECTMQCSPYQNNVCNSRSVFGTEDTLWIFAVFYLLGYIFYAPIGSIGDAMTYYVLGKEARLYGRQRVWGTISFALFALSATFIVDLINTNTPSDFFVSFYGFAAMMLITAYCSWKFPRPESISTKNDFKQLCKLFTSGQVVLFLFILFYFGFLKGTRDTFLFWYLSELEGYRPIIPGLCTLASSIVEMIVFQFGDIITGRLGHVRCLCLILIAYATRFLSYSFLSNAWYVLPVELLHGLTFSFMLYSASSYAKTIAPPGMLATVQGLVSGIYSGIGRGIGSIITGFMYPSLGFVRTFQVYSFTSVGLLVLFVVVHRLCFKSSPLETEKKSAEEESPNDLSTVTEIYVLEIADEIQYKTNLDMSGLPKNEVSLTYL